MSEEFSIFKRFPTLQHAYELQDLLHQHRITAIVADDAPPVDVTFSAGSSSKDIYEVRISRYDFKKAEEILQEDAKKLIAQVPKDHYLFEFTNEELYDILIKADEWSTFDYTLAQHILNQRGEHITQEVLQDLKNKRLKALATPESNQQPWIIMGYIFAIFGGFLGILIGYFLWTNKKTLPNGQKVYAHTANDRTQGKFIFYLGLIILPITVIVRFLHAFYTR